MLPKSGNHWLRVISAYVYYDIGKYCKILGNVELIVLVRFLDVSPRFLLHIYDCNAVEIKWLV